MRVIDDDSIPNAVLTGSLKALFQDGDYSDYVLEELINSVGIRCERMYSYAERKYPIGLPSGEYLSSNQGRQQVEAVIEGIEGRQVLIEYSNYGPPNLLHLGWMILISNHGYNQTTNKLANLTTIKGRDVYLKDMVVVLPQANISLYESGAFEQWGIAPNNGIMPDRFDSLGLLQHSPIKITSTTVPYLEITYSWDSRSSTQNTSILNPPVMQDEKFNIYPSGYDDTADYFQVKYSYQGAIKYWMYKNKSGTYPTLDNVFIDGPAESGSYFPFIYFRHSKKPANQSMSVDSYKAMKKMAKTIGMDYELILENINKNPDIADVEQAMLMFAVPPMSTNQAECRYLFDYFETMFYSFKGTGTTTSVIDLEQSRRTLSPAEAIYAGLDNISEVLVHDPMKEYTTIIKDNLFKKALSHKGIYKSLIAGTIGNVGTYSSSYVKLDVEYEVENPFLNSLMKITIPKGKFLYKKQITEGLYEQIEVIDLKMTYYVYGNYTTVGDDQSNFLLVPLDRTITRKYPIQVREELYSRSMHFIFNSRVVTKVKWYQTGIFKIFIIVVAVVITFYTAGSGSSAIGVALGLTGTAALMATIVISVMISFFIPLILPVFVKTFGKDIAMILAVIAIIYGGYEMFNAGSITGAPWASEIMQLGNGLIKAVQESNFLDLMKDMEQFNTFADARMKELEKAEKLLEGNHLNPMILFGESPEDFYNRTVHSGNIGILGINAISSYVDVALTLPKLKDTIGANAHV